MCINFSFLFPNLLKTNFKSGVVLYTNPAGIIHRDKFMALLCDITTFGRRWGHLDMCQLRCLTAVLSWFPQQDAPPRFRCGYVPWEQAVSGEVGRWVVAATRPSDWHLPVTSRYSARSETLACFHVCTSRSPKCAHNLFSFSYLIFP